MVNMDVNTLIVFFLSHSLSLLVFFCTQKKRENQRIDNFMKLNRCATYMNYAWNCHEIRWCNFKTCHYRYFCNLITFTVVCLFHGKQVFPTLQLMNLRRALWTTNDCTFVQYKRISLDVAHLCRYIKVFSVFFRYLLMRSKFIKDMWDE